jgi:hypothetical protein
MRLWLLFLQERRCAFVAGRFGFAEEEVGLSVTLLLAARPLVKIVTSTPMDEFDRNGLWDLDGDRLSSSSLLSSLLPSFISSW